MQAYQSDLNEIAAKDTYGFLQPSESNWDTHRPLLWLGLSLTEGAVVEMGSGFGSTPYLRKACKETNRYFVSMDSNKEWADKMESQWIPPANWMYYERVWAQQSGLLFVDHSPGEHRWKAIQAAVDKADVIVYHDSEIGGAGNYQYDRILPLFEYALHFNRHGGGAGASMVSNKIDVSKYKGLSFGNIQFDND